MNDGTFIILALLIWLLLAAIRSIGIVGTGFSRFELDRRVKSGDMAAIELRAYENRVPDIQALKYLVETVLLAILVTVLVIGLGVGSGILMSVAAMLVLPFGTRIGFLSSFANDFYKQRETQLLGFATRWQIPLSLLHGNIQQSQRSIQSREELLYLAKQSSHIFTEDQINTMSHVLEFENRQVSDIMTPRSVIDSIEVGETAGPLVLDALHKTGHSRFPVIDKDVDHVVGVLYLRDMVPLKPGKKKIKDAMRPEVFYIRQDQTLEHALHAFLRTHHHLFIVVNEFRETVGLLSLEDVIEALIGRSIVDEFDEFDNLRKVAESNPRKNNQPNKHEDI